MEEMASAAISNGEKKAEQRISISMAKMAKENQINISESGGNE